MLSVMNKYILNNTITEIQKIICWYLIFICFQILLFICIWDVIFKIYVYVVIFLNWDIIFIILYIIVRCIIIILNLVRANPKTVMKPNNLSHMITQPCVRERADVTHDLYNACATGVCLHVQRSRDPKRTSPPSVESIYTYDVHTYTWCNSHLCTLTFR